MSSNSSLPLNAPPTFPLLARNSSATLALNALAVSMSGGCRVMLVEASGELASIPAGGPKWSIPLLKTGGSAARDDRLVTDSARTDRPTPDVDVVVVGAGIAGLYLAYRLSRARYRLRVFEAADDLGGTWYWNRYPGARVDVPSIDYMYSFDPDWQRDWQWSEKYATQPEILRYLNHVADKHDLRRHITFSTRVRQAGWDDSASLWRVRTDGGDDVSARFVVMATGCLSMPKHARGRRARELHRRGLLHQPMAA